MVAAGMEEFSIDLTNIAVKAEVDVQVCDGRRFKARCRLETKVRKLLHAEKPSHPDGCLSHLFL